MLYSGSLVGSGDRGIPPCSYVERRVATVSVVFGWRWRPERCTSEIPTLTSLVASLRSPICLGVHLVAGECWKGFQTQWRGCAFTTDKMADGAGAKELEIVWEDATARARYRLNRNRREVIPELEKQLLHLCRQWVRDTPEWRLAVCLWLEELGPVLNMPLDGHIFQAYDVRGLRGKFEALDERGAAKMRDTLKAAARRFLECIGERPYDCKKAWRSQHPAMALKVDLWRALTGMKDLCNRGTMPVFRNWMRSWDEGRRLELWEELERGAERLRMRANVFDWSPECEARWVQAEAKYITASGGPNPRRRSCPLSKEGMAGKRRRLMDELEVSLAAQSKESGLEFMETVQAEWEVATHSLRVVQLRLQREMAAEVKRLQADKEALEVRNRELQEESRRFQAVGAATAQDLALELAFEGSLPAG